MVTLLKKRVSKKKVHMNYSFIFEDNPADEILSPKLFSLNTLRILYCLHSNFAIEKPDVYWCLFLCRRSPFFLEALTFTTYFLLAKIMFYIFLCLHFGTLMCLFDLQFSSLFLGKYSYFSFMTFYPRAPIASVLTLLQLYSLL